MLSYAPYAVFNIANPLLTIIFAYAGFECWLTVRPRDKSRERANRSNTGIVSSQRQHVWRLHATELTIGRLSARLARTRPHSHRRRRFVNQGAESAA